MCLSQSSGQSPRALKPSLTTLTTPLSRGARSAPRRTNLVSLPNFSLSPCLCREKTLLARERRFVDYYVEVNCRFWCHRVHGARIRWMPEQPDDIETNSSYLHFASYIIMELYRTCRNNYPWVNCASSPDPCSRDSLHFSRNAVRKHSTATVHARGGPKAVARHTKPDIRPERCGDLSRERTRGVTAARAA